MKLLIIVAASVALAAARPEMYKEQEDFQYSRSSTDEGSKAGFYGAQRGNMGGNYERAHNMDGLAQHQMSTAVKQVNGELGDALNTRTGSVFTSANSQGLYGSGNYDLSNLHGRNFAEGVHAYDGSQSHASLSSHHGYDSQRSASSLHSSGYNSHAHGSGYGHHGSNSYGHSGNLQAVDSTHGAGFGQAESHSSGYHSESGYQAQSSTANQHSLHSGYAVQPQSRLVLATPVRVVGRPGQRVAIPVGVQTYDATHSASTLDHNAIDINEAEVLSNADTVTFRPTSNAKSYESAYSYRKQWEKHDVKPEVIALSMPTENPFPKNSELYDDTHSSNNNYHASGYNANSGYSGSLHSNSHIKSTSAAQQGYLHSTDSLHSNLATGSLSDAHSHGAYSTGHSADALNAVGTLDKPKGYQSSYSYHKSWERQGDPYVIKPVGGAYVDEASQQLSASSNHAHSSQYQTSQTGALEECDCDEYGHVRVARSTNHDQDQYQTPQNWESVEDLGQQVQKNDWAVSQLRNGQIENLEDLGQQVQKNDWVGSPYRGGKLESQNLEDLGQHVQKNDWIDSQERRRQHENLEDLGQQVQKNDWIGSQYRSGQLESQNREDLVQQVQKNDWTDSRHRNLHQENQNLGQETQQTLNSNFDREQKSLYGRGDLGQQASSQWHPAEENTKWRY